MLFAQYVAFLPTERIRSQMWRERRERGPSPIRSAKQRAATTRYIYICVHPTPSLPFPPEIIKSWHISSSRENALCRRVSSTEIPAERLLYEPGTESNVLESPDGPDSKGWNPPSFSLFVPLNRPVRHLWSIAEIGLEQLGTFRCFFLSFLSFLFLLLSLRRFLSCFPSLFFFPRSVGCLCFIRGATRGESHPCYIYISFLEEEERKYFPTSERILERSSKCGGERVEGEGGEGQVSARNRSLTAVLHELPLSVSIFLYLFFPSRPRPMVIARAMPRRATPRDARRSYGPPGVPGHSSGNRSASVARGTR